MPRLARSSYGGYCYHVINRGNEGRSRFLNDDDYGAFMRAVSYAHARLPMRVLAYCLLPNHFHLVLWPIHDGDLSRWMQWMLNTQVRRHHQRYKSSGHLWQGRFKAFPVAQDEHLLSLMRFVERNPLRAGLCERAEEWKWSSATWWKEGAESPPFASYGPAPRAPDWLSWIAAEPSPEEQARILECIERSRPFGDERWMQATAEKMGLQPTLRPRGRPRVRPLDGAVANCEE